MTLCIAIILACSALAAQEPQERDSQKQAPETPFVELTKREFSFYPGGRVEIFGQAPGNWKVIGWHKASVMVEFEKIVYHLEPVQAKVLADQFPIQVRWGQTTATLRTAAPPKSLASLEVNAVLYVPKEKTDLKVQLVSGDLTIGGINGWVEANLTSGSIEAKSMSGYFSAVTQSGDLTVEMSGKRWQGYGFTGVTNKGSIALRLPVDYSAALQFDARNGKITISFPEQVVEGESVPWQVMTKKNASTITATVGQGGASVKLLTLLGDIGLSTTDSP